MSGRFAIVKKGYDTEAVDRYISTLEAQVDMYREKDMAINNAIVSAQRAADDIIYNAKRQSRVIRESVAKQVMDISLATDHQRRLLTDFAQEYSMIASKYLKVADNADFDNLSRKIDALEEYLTNFSEELTEDLELEKRNADNEN
ncbi:MAG: DivIVA domain-containing protein [Defluviitaleaceae bacterium]|nr:DivIVA domain-containing protein [Defluviitaleaceae bacterium]